MNRRFFIQSLALAGALPFLPSFRVREQFNILNLGGVRFQDLLKVASFKPILEEGKVYSNLKTTAFVKSHDATFVHCFGKSKYIQQVYEVYHIYNLADYSALKTKSWHLFLITLKKTDIAHSSYVQYLEYLEKVGLWVQLYLKANPQKRLVVMTDVGRDANANAIKTAKDFGLDHCTEEAQKVFLIECKAKRPERIEQEQDLKKIVWNYL